MISPNPAGRPLAFFLPSLSGGGAERITVNLAAGFAERGFATDVVLASAEGPFLAQLPPGVRLIDLKAGGVLSALRPLAAYLRRERPLVLVSALNHANLVAMAAARMPGSRTRVVITIHCTIARELLGATDARTRVVPRLLGLLHPLADAIVAVSEGVADDASQQLRIPRRRFEVIYNPVITPGLLEDARQAPAHPWFDDRTRPIVLGVGRLEAQKNFPLLVDAFALLTREHDARLVILGEGPERAAIEARVKHHGLESSVAMPGFVDNPYACMARASVFALSSDFEGLPTALIESLAVGTPVVSTDCPSGPREILRDGAFGSLVPVGDPVALASAISKAIGARREPPPWDALQAYMPDVVLDRYQQVLAVHA